mgnify:CR=1 FL=1
MVHLSPTGRGEPRPRRADSVKTHPALEPLGRGVLAMRHVDAVGGIFANLVPQGSDRESQHARGAGAIAVAARERLQHQFALDFVDGRADQQRDDFIWSQRRQQRFRRRYGGRGVGVRL